MRKSTSLSDEDWKPQKKSIFYYGTYISIRMDNHLSSTPSYNVNRIRASTYFIPTATKKIRRIWAIPSILFLSIAMVFSANFSIQERNGSDIYQYLSSGTINNDFSRELGYFIDPLRSIMTILITTVGIMVLIDSENEMSHDQGY